jgi:hydroxyethylthiazole kinase-like uncharacterized protein yjeF
MQIFDKLILKKLYIPPAKSHKGQNGKLLLISGSKLFHSSSLWALKVASRILDMVYYCSVDENNEIIKQAKQEFRDGIVVPRGKVEDYISEADCILIGPGLPRVDGQEAGDDDTKALTESLLKKYASKKWVIDGGSLQTIDPQLIPPNAILTPHHKEFEKLFNFQFPISNLQSNSNEQISKIQKKVGEMAKKYNCIIILKGPTDIVCSPKKCMKIDGGNAGMTKGGTGDVLASLIASLYCKNDDPFLVAQAGSYLNKKAGERLFKKVGYYFNASDLVDEIPKIMRSLILS